jgi:thiamine kinase-like enzyme
VKNKKPLNYYGCAFNVLKEDDERKPKWAEQRDKWGFDDTETWNLDNTIVDFILPRLKRFVKVTNGYPNEFKNMREWKKTLNKIIKGLEKYEDDFRGEESKEAIGLLFKHFSSLWW